jgi:class 3 adenylate cyclase
MLCGKCGNNNPADSAFCEGCGANLELICSTCKTLASPGARFCKKCGTAFAAKVPDSSPTSPPESLIKVTAGAGSVPGVIDGERKTVTALFADIKGSTELMEDLDPEEARAIIDPALRLMIDAVNRYDGYVVQSTGDGIFALFGAPVAHEDHPQRALYAALRMQEDLGHYSARIVADGGMPIEARVGANTGEVVVRSIATGARQTEYTPIGHTTNLASRMQAVAPTGSIAVSEQTRKFVEGYFQLKPLGPTKVKGVSDPVNVYEVTGPGATAHAPATFGGARTDEVRGARARDGSPQARCSAGQFRARPDRSCGGRGRSRQVAAIVRVQSDISVGLDGAGDVFGLA